MRFEKVGVWATVWFACSIEPRRRMVYACNGRWYVRDYGGRNMMRLDDAMGYVLEAA